MNPSIHDVIHRRQALARDGNAFASTARIWDDGILDPRNTRKALGLALAMCLENQTTPETRYGVFRM